MADRLLVLNKDADTLSVIEADTGVTERIVETAFNPHEIEVLPDKGKAYVSCSLGDTVLVFDTTTWEELARIEHEAFEFPHGFAYRASADELWLASTYSSEIFVIDAETDEIRTHVPTYQDKSHMIAFGPEERQAFIANIGSDTVTVLDADTQQLMADIEVGAGPEGIAVHPTAGVLVANQDDGRLSVFDPETFEEHGQALLGTTPIRVVPSPNGRYVLIPNRESNDVSVIDTEHTRDGEQRPWEIQRIPVGIWPGGTTFNPDGTRAFVANNKTNDVSVIDTNTWTEQTRYETGIHPDGIAYLPQ